MAGYSVNMELCQIDLISSSFDTALSSLLLVVTAYSLLFSLYRCSILFALDYNFLDYFAPLIYGRF